MINLGNSFSLSEPKKASLSKRLFKIDRVSVFIECMEVLRHHVKNKKRMHVSLLGEEEYKYKAMREAYFCWIEDIQSSAVGDGLSKIDKHEQLKGRYLIRILSREYTFFADLVVRSQEPDNSHDKEGVKKLLSISDSSIVTFKIFKEYFKEVQASEQS